VARDRAEDQENCLCFGRQERNACCGEFRLESDNFQRRTPNKLFDQRLMKTSIKEEAM
jgi:hypothetical protein